MSGCQRCGQEGCKKKLPLTAFPCRCGLYYCDKHRSDVIHNCSYDYKGAHLKHLSTTLPKVVSKQVETI